MSWEREDIRLATSKAGHDKGEVFVVVGEDGECFYLADGKSRRVGEPKKKNSKHVQIIRKIPEDALAVLAKGQPPDDVAVKRAIKLYNQAIKSGEE